MIFLVREYVYRRRLISRGGGEKKLSHKIPSHGKKGRQVMGVSCPGRKGKEGEVE